MTVTIRFDASLSERDSGACFQVTARDQAHARQITAWLRSKVKDTSKTFVSAHGELPAQSFVVELPDELA